MRYEEAKAKLSSGQEGFSPKLILIVSKDLIQVESHYENHTK